MKVSNSRLERLIALGLAMSLVVPIGAAATIPPPQQKSQADLGKIASEPPSQAAKQEAPAAGNLPTATLATAHPLTSFPVTYLPDAPGTDAPGTASPSPAGQQTADPTQQTSTSQSAQPGRQNSAQPPVGTAAAPYEKPDGVPASRPAGAAIAPAKQRRIHTFAIRAALLVGAGVAIGVVAAASLGSPSRPQ